MGSSLPPVQGTAKKQVGYELLLVFVFSLDESTFSLQRTNTSITFFKLPKKKKKLLIFKLSKNETLRIFRAIPKS